MNTEIVVASDTSLMRGADFSRLVAEESKTLNGRSLVIADAGLKDVHVLVGQLDQGSHLWNVDSSTDIGVLLKDALHSGYDRLHFLGHGQSGEISFGSRALQVDDFTALIPDKGVKTPSLHFWSCMTGAGVKGVAFVEGIAKAFGVAVTAFSNLVGAKGLGGSWVPDVCSYDAEFVEAPFVNTLAYQHTLQTSVLNLIAVPAANGEDVQVWLKGGITIDVASLYLSYDTTKATYTGAVQNPALPGWIWVPNQNSGQLAISGISLVPLSSTDDILLETISFALESGSTGSSLSFENGTELSINDIVIPLGTLPELKPPTVLTFNPVDASIGTPVTNNVVLTFTEAIQKGTGLIEIHSESATGNVVASYDVATSDNLVIDGNVLTINPTANLATETNYFVTFAAGSIVDLAGNSYSGTTTYNFTTALPVNDFAPVLSVDNASLSLAENAAAGAISGTIAHASDADGDTVTYSLVNVPVDSSSSPLFDIDSSTGQLILMAAGAAAIDYESSTKSYALTVKASDGLVAHDQTATVAINLTNVNDNAPVIHAENATVSLPENSLAGGITGARVTASDADGDTVTYSLVNGPVNNSNLPLFSVDTTGQLSLTAAGALAIDYDSAIRSYDLSVRASDGLTAHDQTVTLAVTLTNVNDVPTGGVTIAGRVKVDETLRATSTLLDSDGLGTISYQWYSGGNAITGATSETLLVGNAQEGQTILVKASYIDGQGAAESASSDAIPYGAELSITPVSSAIDLSTALTPYFAAFTNKTDVQNRIATYYAHPMVVQQRNYSTSSAATFAVNSSGHEAFVIALSTEATLKTLVLNNVEFAIISGNNINVIGGEGDNIVFADGGSQNILLGAGNDELHGGDGNDTVASTTGNDILYGDGGNDVINGGEGVDTAGFSGNFADYTITFDGTRYTVLDKKISDGNDGEDIVTNVEYLKFLDGTKDVHSLDVTAGAVTYVPHEVLGVDGGDTVFVGLVGTGVLAWVIHMFF